MGFQRTLLVFHTEYEHAQLYLRLVEIIFIGGFSPQSAVAHDIGYACSVSGTPYEEVGSDCTCTLLVYVNASATQSQMYGVHTSRVQTTVGYPGTLAEENDGGKPTNTFLR